MATENEIKTFKENCSLLSDEQIHRVMACCVEGMKASMELDKAGVEISGDSNDDRFQTCAIGALLVAEEYAKRTGKEYPKASELLGKVEPSYRETSVLEMKRAVLPNSTVSISAEPKDVYNVVSLIQRDVNKNASNRANEAPYVHRGKLQINLSIADEARKILRDPVKVRQEESARLAESKKFLDSIKINNR